MNKYIRTYQMDSLFQSSQRYSNLRGIKTSSGGNVYRTYIVPGTHLIQEDFEEATRSFRLLGPDVKIQVVIRTNFYEASDEMPEGHTEYSTGPFVDYWDAMHNFKTFMDNQYGNYEEGLGIDLQFSQLYITTMTPVAAIFGQGAAARSIKQANKKWYVYSPISRLNCLYHAVQVQRFPAKLGQFLESNEKLAKSAQCLKVKVNPSNKVFGDAISLQECANYIKEDIQLYDNLYRLSHTYKPTKYRAKRRPVTIRYTNRNHYEALVRWYDITEDAREIISKVEAERAETHRSIQKTVASNGGHILIKKHRIRKPFCDDICAWDIETSSKRVGSVDINETYAIGTAWKGGYKGFWGKQCVESWLEWLNEESAVFDGHYFYAHNGGKFDVQNIMLELMQSPHWTIDSQKHEMVDLDSRIIKLAIYNSSGHFIHFRDSCAMLTGSLDKLCKDFGVSAEDAKGEANHDDIELYIREHGCSRVRDAFPGLENYLERDCKGLLNILLQFNRIVYDKTYVGAWKDKPGGGIRMVDLLTAASYAKKLFYQKYYYKNLWSLNKETDQFIRGSYAGGRTEAFYLGHVERKLWYVDFTSLYPSVAAANRLPVGKPEYVAQFDKPDKYSFIRCMVRTTALGMTAKPLHSIKHNYKMLFPHFPDWTEMVLYSAEIQYGMDTGHYEYQLLDGQRFQGDNLLKACMTDGFVGKAKAKSEGKSALAASEKLIINSVYGVFGFNPYNRESVKLIHDPDNNPALIAPYIQSNQLVNESKYGDYKHVRISQDLPISDFNVSVAAAITSLGRVRITQLIHAIEKKGKVYYCDTDSVICDIDVKNDPELAAEFMPDGTGDALGSLKNEIDDELVKRVKKGAETQKWLDELKVKHNSSVPFTSLVVGGAKYYSLQGQGIEISKCKGRRDDGTLTHRKFLDVIYKGGTIDQRQLQFRCPKEAWLDETKPYQMAKTYTMKRFGFVYSKGTRMPDGNVVPYNF